RRRGRPEHALERGKVSLLVAERATEIAELRALDLLGGDGLGVEVDRQQLSGCGELCDRDIPGGCGCEGAALGEAQDGASGDKGEAAASGAPQELCSCGDAHRVPPGHPRARSSVPPQRLGRGVDPGDRARCPTCGFEETYAWISQ